MQGDAAEVLRGEGRLDAGRSWLTGCPPNPVVFSPWRWSRTNVVYITSCLVESVMAFAVLRICADNTITVQRIALLSSASSEAACSAANKARA